MRLPQFEADIAPIGDVLTAGEAGEQLLKEEVHKRNARILVETADDEGLSLWEKDFGLPNGTSLDSTLRRGRIRGAISGGQTLTPDRLKSMAVNIAGADTGEVYEDFGNHSVELTVICGDKLPKKNGMDALRQTLDRQMPSHLNIKAIPCAALTLNRAEACHAGMLRIIYSSAPPLP